MRSKPTPPVAAPIEVKQASSFISEARSAPTPAPAAHKGYVLHIDGTDIPMDDMDTADDGFVQMKERSMSEEGAYVSLSLESN